jgi:UDP-N-acetyl-D-mannosaminuronic acid dehydrogenase
LKACVVGIGRVGLPLALFLASKGIFTYGLDIDQEKVKMLKKGKFPFREEGGQRILEENLGKKFEPTTDFSKAADADYLILAIGIPVDEYLNPEFSQLENALDSLFPNLRKGQTLLLKSTVSPRTTEYVRDLIERRKGFAIGKDFFLAFCPERIAEGRAFQELENLPEIVGGADEKSGKMAAELWKSIGKEVYITTSINAELLKLFTNSYRYINFALANEFMMIAENWGADIYEIAELSNRNYPRGGAKKPGFTGGPCLSKDGLFLTRNVPFPDLFSTAWMINERLPAYLVGRAKALKETKGAKCAILGMAFKADHDDVRASLSYKIKKLFKMELADVHTHDVYQNGPEFWSTVKDADFLVIATAHKEYKKPLEEYMPYLKPGAVVIDVWNIFGRKSAVFRLD